MYTYIFYFRGGTYISQVQCSDLKKSMVEWAENIVVSEIRFLGEKMKTQLRSQVEEEVPTSINNIYNVWYADFLLFGIYAYVHIIKMDK